MCVIAAKYLPEYGWVAGKNRDRSYKPEIHIKQSFRDGIERCLLWDSETKWTEGVNEFGIGILNTTLLVKKDEKENKFRQKDEKFYSPGGRSIRRALLCNTALDALNSLVENETEGFSFVFSKDESYLLEAPVYVGKESEYECRAIKLNKDKVYVRTNHGIIFPDAGYPKDSDDPAMVASRESSESRYKIVHEGMSKVKEPMDILRVLSSKPNDDSRMNPLRESDTHGKHIMVTTGQILLIPSERTLHYRPVWCELQFDFQKLDSNETKTFFEVVSSRKLVTDKVASELIRIARELAGFSGMKSGQYPIGMHDRNKVYVDSLRKGLEDKQIPNATLNEIKSQLGGSFERAEELLIREFDKDGGSLRHKLYDLDVLGASFSRINKMLRLLKKAPKNKEITAYTDFIESWAPVGEMLKEVKKYALKRGQLRDLEKKEKEDQIFKVISIGAMKKVHDELRGVLEKIHPYFVKSMYDWLMSYAEEFAYDFENKGWLNKLNERRQKEHQDKLELDFYRDLSVYNRKNNTSYGMNDVVDGNAPQEIVDRYLLLERRYPSFRPSTYNIKDFANAKGIAVADLLGGMIDIEGEEDSADVSISLSPNARSVAMGFGEEQYEIVKKKYLAKNVEKLAIIIENKEKSGAGVTLVDTKKIEHEGASFNSIVRIEFQDGTGFLVDNKAVSKSSQSMTWFYQYPTTFHQVHFLDGSVKAMVPERGMLSVWSKQGVKTSNVSRDFNSVKTMDTMSKDLVKLARTLVGFEVSEFQQ